MNAELTALEQLTARYGETVRNLTADDITLIESGKDLPHGICQKILTARAQWNDLQREKSLAHDCGSGSEN